MMKKLFLISVKLIISIIFAITAYADECPEPTSVSITIPFSPNPVGSGARALGYSAFIAVADDATAASWNPGALIQLKNPEASIVGNWFYRNEDNSFAGHPEAEGSHDISDQDINYLSFAYPFRLYNRNMIVSLNYQRLYDFTRELSFDFKEQSKNNETGEPIPDFYADEDIHQQQSGNLSAIGLAYSFEIIPQSLSFGFTFNIWDDELCDNKWKQKYSFSATYVEKGETIGEGSFNINHKFIFDGYNFNLGMLWHSQNRKLSIGAVFKSPFTADLRHEFDPEQTDCEPIIMNKKLEMPMSYGLGIAYRFSDNFTVAGDVYRTHWDDFIIEEEDGTETSAVTAKPIDETDVDPTIQARLGAEYLFINKTSNYVIPLRGGLFFDPAPAEGNPDDYYGLSIGSGFAKGRYIFDIAAQYRFGRDVGDSVYPNYEFSQDVDEVTIYMSLVIHLDYW
ncbi:hypothetical protein QUF70_08690 [Desulfobacterales bacterium HSG17]|nr:hypothetical protein [Desulfobacterales bacterium HSG17]